MIERDTVGRYRADQAKSLVGFVVGDVTYAVEIARVQEIVNPLPFVTLPHVPPEVVGVADHRGQVVPVVDLRTRFGLERQAPTRRTKWLVVTLEATAVALVVDAVTDVFGTHDDDQRSVPQLGGGEEQRGIATVVRHQGTLVFVVDPARVAQGVNEVDPFTAQLAIGMGGAPA